MEDSQLKQRIVGAIVLVSLAVIFIPMILSGGDPAATGVGKTIIPPKPPEEFVSRIIPLDKQAPETAVDPEPTPAPVADSKPAAKPAPKPAAGDKDEPAPKPVATPAPTTTTTAKAGPAAVNKKKPALKKGVTAWVVQVGSFSSKDNAYGLRDKLRKKGFNAFVDSLHENSKTSYRVRIGPEIKKADANELLVKAQKITRTKGFVTRYP